MKELNLNNLYTKVWLENVSDELYFWWDRFLTCDWRDCEKLLEIKKLIK